MDVMGLNAKVRCTCRLLIKLNDYEKFNRNSMMNVTRIADGCTIRFNMGPPPGLELGRAFRLAYQRRSLRAS